MINNEELVYALRNNVGVSDYSRFAAALAADRIEQLVKERDALEKRVAELDGALRTIAEKPLHDGFLVGWWIDSTIETARTVLDELEKTE